MTFLAVFSQAGAAGVGGGGRQEQICLSLQAREEDSSLGKSMGEL